MYMYMYMYMYMCVYIYIYVLRIWCIVPPYDFTNDWPKSPSTLDTRPRWRREAALSSLAAGKGGVLFRELMSHKMRGFPGTCKISILLGWSIGTLGQIFRCCQSSLGCPFPQHVEGFFPTFGAKDGSFCLLIYPFTPWIFIWHVGRDLVVDGKVLFHPHGIIIYNYICISICIYIYIYLYVIYIYRCI